IFQREAIEEEHQGEYCRRNCMELIERMGQRDYVIEALKLTRNHEQTVRVVAYLREIQIGDMEKLDWYRVMVMQSNNRLRRKQWFLTVMMNQ
ncbi:hypothetical protein Tco_1463218, partial [Tanacetum coccineum]